jgi:hypothetical protein
MVALVVFAVLAGLSLAIAAVTAHLPPAPQRRG